MLKICRFSQVESSAAPQLSAWFQMIRRMALAHAAGSVKVPAKPESEGQKSLGISRGQEMFEAPAKIQVQKL